MGEEDRLVEGDEAVEEEDVFVEAAEDETDGEVFFVDVVDLDGLREFVGESFFKCTDAHNFSIILSPINPYK